MNFLKAIACTTAVAGLTAAASGQVMWSDDFESYAVGSGILGQGGWTTWDGTPAWDSLVTDAQALSGTNSLDVVAASDTVYPWIDEGLVMTEGRWRVTANTYVATGLDAVNDTYFILLSEWAPNYDWRVQLHWDPDTDTVIADFDVASAPIIYDEWVPITVEVDLFLDTHSIWYGNTLLIDNLSWTGSMNGGGILQLAACDLFAYDAVSSVYYDDMSVEYLGDSGPCLDVTWDNNNAGGTIEFCATGGIDGRQVGIFYSFDPTAFDGFVACWDDCRGQGGSAVQCGQICLGSSFKDQIGIGKFVGDTYCNSVKVPCAAGGKTVYLYAVTVGADGKICDSAVTAITFNPC
ncbi:MAG: hypothetical protein D8M59_03470 [Planctomycetes bacterium]|nr:hypothetical protein [Planctomycetota bacterium]